MNAYIAMYTTGSSSSMTMSSPPLAVTRVTLLTYMSVAKLACR